MDDKEAELYIKNYFDQLFGKKNIDSLDSYLHKDYWDDDIGDSNVNHVENSKRYLENLFKENPQIGIDVNRVIAYENTIIAYLTWYENKNNVKKVLRKGVAIFEIENTKIKKRHTYLYNK